MIQTTDRVLGGASGPANAQAVALLKRAEHLRVTLDTVNAALTGAQNRLTTAETNLAAAINSADTAQQIAQAATQAGGAASAAAATAQSAATAAQGVATNAQTVATAAQSAVATAAALAGAAETKAIAAQTAVAAKATRFDLGSVTIVYSAAIILGAGARSIEATCPGALPGDAIFVAPTGAVPVGYAVGAAQCLVADKIQVSIVHPALALGASFSIPMRVFALR